MEAVSLHGSWDNRKSHVKTPQRTHQSLVISRSYDYDRFPQSNFHSMGFQQAAPPLFVQHHNLRPPQPPLLPLPAAHHGLAAAGRALSLPPANKSSCRTNNNSLTPKKSKSLNRNVKKQEIIRKSAKLVGIGSQEVLLSASGSGSFNNITTDNARSVEGMIGINNVNFGGSKIYTTSPSPSSLPLPKFLRPKLKCSAAAAVGGDTGATDKLRRLLQLQ